MANFYDEFLSLMSESKEESYPAYMFGVMDIIRRADKMIETKNEEPTTEENISSEVSVEENTSSEVNDSMESINKEKEVLRARVDELQRELDETKEALIKSQEANLEVLTRTNVKEEKDDSEYTFADIEEERKESEN